MTSKLFFYPLPLYDVLEITGKTGTDNISFTASGIAIAGDTENNLCIKAYRLLKKEYPQLPPVDMYLHKTIPAGAGLGGGSADGAFTLKLLNDTFQLNLSTAELMKYAAQLGSDCPFFISNTPGFATGRGDILEPINVDLGNYKFVFDQSRYIG
ncbi:MAG: hypothetical protein WDO16_08450 [Bacteroidota bacterium]